MSPTRSALTLRKGDVLWSMHDLWAIHVDRGGKRPLGHWQIGPLPSSMAPVPIDLERLAALRFQKVRSS